MKMMSKVHSIDLTGPLARNERIRLLRTGDIVHTKVTDILDAKTAVLNLLGNRVKAHFEDNTHFKAGTTLTLQITGSKEGVLHFKLHEGSGQTSWLSMITEGQNRDLALFLKSYTNEISDIFQFLARFKAFKRKQTFQDKREVYLQLLKKGYSLQSLSKLSLALGPYINEKLAYMAKKVYQKLTLHNDSSVELENTAIDMLESFEKDDLVSVLQLFDDSETGVIILDIDNNPIFVTLFRDIDALIVDFAFKDFSAIQLIARENKSSLQMQIFISNEQYRNRLGDEIGELRMALGHMFANVSIHFFSMQEVVSGLRSEADNWKERSFFDTKA